MKKSHRFDELSDKRCSCGKKLKKRLVESKEARKITKCYQCGLDEKRAKAKKAHRPK